MADEYIRRDDFIQYLEKCKKGAAVTNLVWAAIMAIERDVRDMPACRMCNHYKRANSLETFRRYIAEIPRKLRENYIYKVGVVYGNVIENEKPIKFYFEEMEGKKNV